MADIWDEAVPVSGEALPPASDPWAEAVPVPMGTAAGPLTPERANREAEQVEGKNPALQAPDVDPVAIAANAPTLGLPAVIGELARPFVKHYVAEPVERATGSPLAGAAAEIATPLLAGQLPNAAGKALSAGRYIVGAPSSAELEEVGTEAADTARKGLAKAEEKLAGPAEDVAKTAGAANVIEATGGDASKRAAEAAAPFDNPELARQADLARADAKASAVAPVGRLFTKKGQQIGALLEPYKDVPVNSENLGDTVASINQLANKNAYDLSPAVQKELEMANAESASQMTAGQAIGRLQKMQAMIGGLRGGRNESGDRMALGQLRNSYENIVDDMKGDLPPDVQKEYGALKSEYGTLKGAFDTHGRDIYNQADQIGVAKNLLNLNKDDWGKVVAEATPGERNNLSDVMARYIVGDDEKPNPEEVIKRFNEVRAANPTAAKVLFGDSQFQTAQSWADTATKTQSLLKDMKDPTLQAPYVGGWKLAENSPEAQRLNQAMEEFKKIPPPEQKALEAKIERVQSGSPSNFANKMFGYGARRIVFDSAIAAGSGGTAGFVSRNPMVALGLGSTIMARSGIGAMIKNHPQEYLDMLARANGTAQGMRQVGYYAAKISMADMAREIEDAMTGPQRQPQP